MWGAALRASRRAALAAAATLCVAALPASAGVTASQDTRPAPQFRSSPTALAPPTRLRLVRASRAAVTLRWRAVRGASGYRVYRNGNLAANTTLLNSTLDDLSCGRSYRLAVQAYNRSGKGSRYTSLHGSTRPCNSPGDSNAPSVPQGLHIARTSKTTATMAWNASHDNSRVTGYRLYKNDIAIATTTKRNYTYTRLTCNTTYQLSIEAYDHAGNASYRPQAVAPATTKPCTNRPPTTPPRPRPPKPAPVPAGSANLWIDVNGGSCARPAAPAEYDDARACGSFAAAYAAAVSGDFIRVRAGMYSPQFFAGGVGGTQGRGNKQVTFKGERGTVLRGLHSSSPRITYDGLRIDGGGVKSSGALLEMGNADYGTFKNGSIGNVVDEKGAIMIGDQMRIDNVVFHDVRQVSSGVHNECLFIMAPDHLVMRKSIFRNCATMDVNMSWPDYWSPQPPSFSHVTLENNVFGHSVNGSAWHYYGLTIGGTGPNSGVPPCAQSQKAAAYLVGWRVVNNTFENNVIIGAGGVSCASNTIWANNIGTGWNCMSGITYTGNVGKKCSATDVATPRAGPSRNTYGFVNPAAWDFHLGGSSVAINKGDPSYAPPTDRDGNPRNGRPDAGAYEYGG